ncbi:uncharacterized protein FOMMEDRAFT_140720 [Fomitiporia mediterranea MF3/22]|uniref:uncharacterized protein n=1 Tax=Fomitiporia mediterranea (strain MF3/22) TaxID=694068 RepID=UPI00044083EF|nr:uncharacterized protein FOMMEDRAFT_140720 [Fomitiporia mediterranea MF3/22]EJD02915.1 hypothetical protein FOMMEDRAFT_140720 [Fomitiporia mediterranea MF3/22]
MALSTPAQPSPPQPQQPPSSDNSDLEKLERLKREILEGQNPVYKAVPQPDFLESLYLGRSAKRQNSVPAHPEQIVPSQSETNTALPSNLEHTNGASTVAEVSPLIPSKTSEEKDRTDKEVGSEAPTSTQSAQAMNEGSNSAVVEFISPVKRSPSTPQFEPKVSSIDHHPSFSLGTVSQDTSKPPLDGSLDSTKLKSDMASQLAVLSTSDNVPARSSAEKSPVTSVPLGKAVFTSDPPYDPKESLRNTEFSAFADYRNTHAPGRYDSSSFASPNDTSPEGTHYVGRQRNYGAEWDDRFNYRYADGYSSNYGAKQFSASGVDYEGAHFQDIKRQDTGQSYDDRTDGDLRRFVPGFPDRSVRPAENCPLTSEQTSGLINSVDVTKAASRAAFVPNTTAAPLSSQYAPAEGQLTRNAKSNTYDQSALKESRLDMDGRLLSSNDTGRQSSMDYTSHQENIQASALEGRIGGRAPPPLEDRIGIRIPLEERISSPPDGTPAQPAPMKQEGLFLPPYRLFVLGLVMKKLNLHKHPRQLVLRLCINRPEQASYMSVLTRFFNPATLLTSPGCVHLCREALKSLTVQAVHSRESLCSRKDKSTIPQTLGWFHLLLIV